MDPVCVLSHSAVSGSLRPHGLQPARLLCPWDSPGKNTRVGCYFLLQGIFQTQGSNPRLLHWQVDSLPLRHQRSPFTGILIYENLSKCTFLNTSSSLYYQLFISKAIQRSIKRNNQNKRVNLKKEMRYRYWKKSKIITTS